MYLCGVPLYIHVKLIIQVGKKVWYGRTTKSKRFPTEISKEKFEKKDKNEVK